MIIENQIAQEHDPVTRAMARLAAEGLDRHDCLHAVAWVASMNLYDIVNAVQVDPGIDVQSQYDEAIEKLTAASWLALADDEES